MVDWRDWTDTECFLTKPGSCSIMQLMVGVRLDTGKFILKPAIPDLVLSFSIFSAPYNTYNHHTDNDLLLSFYDIFHDSSHTYIQVGGHDCFSRRVGAVSPAGPTFGQHLFVPCLAMDYHVRTYIYIYIYIYIHIYIHIYTYVNMHVYLPIRY